jgi:hypothetical protein
MKNFCTLTDEQLTTRAKKWIDDLTESHGRAYKLSIPAQYNEDPDLIFQELINRFQIIKAQYEDLKKQTYVNPKNISSDRQTAQYGNSHNRGADGDL